MNDLRRAARTNGFLNLFWPPSANEFQLQFTTNLTAGSTWTTLDASKIISNGLTNGLTSVTVAPHATCTFYRLKQP